MINQKPIVYKKLKELQDEEIVENVCEEGKQDWSKLPCITYLELGNEPSDHGDDAEYSSALAIKADVWGTSSSEVSKIAIQVVNKMKELGYERTLYLDVNDSNSKQRHKTIRFEKDEILEEE